MIGLIWVSIIPTSHAIDPLDRVPISSPRLEDFFQNPVSKNININQQVQIAAHITNNQEIDQKFVYIVQIKDRENVVIHLVWISGELNPHQTLSTAVSWRPELSGSFVAEIFVWESLINQDALSESISFDITAS
ncbi:MAG: hypothetical protein IH841_05430 [Thaumarchaeota archaeon]|nr:hypothetical protein [Nitrososphaerota archaeon]